MEREEAIKWLTNEKWKNANNKYKKEWNEAFDMAIEALSLANLKEEFESAVPNCQKCAIKELWEATEKEDLISVVRCKDCRHQRFYINDKESFCCDKAGIVNMHIDDGDGEFFCKYGERKE